MPAYKLTLLLALLLAAAAFGCEKLPEVAADHSNPIELEEALLECTELLWGLCELDPGCRQHLPGIPL